MSEVQGDRIGIVSLLYDHDQRGLVNNLIDIQHDNSSLTQSSVHVHIDDHNCLEIMTLRGDAKDIKAFAERMMSLKGVKHVKLTTITPGAEL